MFYLYPGYKYTDMLWSLTMHVYSTNTQNVRRGGEGFAYSLHMYTSSRPHRCHVQWLYIIPIFCFSTLFYTCIYIHCYFFWRINFVTFCKMFCLFFNHFCAYNSRKKLLNIITYEIYFKNQLLSLVSSCGYAGIKHGRKNITIPVRGFSLQWSHGL